jgi:4-hydroxybenzoate polyprenyltransferase
VGRVRAAATLLAACHPVPAAAVTAFAVALTAAAGGSALQVTGVGVAVLAGQLAIGWANDAVDAERDLAAGRDDKPVATGALTRRAVATAAVAASAATVPASLLLGPLAGGAHLLGVAAGLAYDLRLKATLASPLPYLVFFGLLPLVAAAAAGAAPSGVLCAVGAVVGLAAHLANTVPDAEADAAAGVRGLPQRIGPRASRVGAAALVVAGALVLGAGAADTGVLSTPVLGLLAAACASGLVGALGRAHGVFALVLVAAALVVAAAVLSAPGLLAPARSA